MTEVESSRSSLHDIAEEIVYKAVRKEIASLLREQQLGSLSQEQKKELDSLRVLYLYPESDIYESLLLDDAEAYVLKHLLDSILQLEWQIEERKNRLKNTSKRESDTYEKLHKEQETDQKTLKGLRKILACSQR